MRKITALLMASASIFMISGCSRNDPPETEKSDVQTEVVVGGFDSVLELRSFLYTNFYKAELNENKDYISEGNASAKFTMRGSSSGAQPQFDIFLDNKYATPKRDFTDVHALSVDVWNQSSSDKTMALSFTTRQTGNIRSTYVEKKFTLKPGYNRVIYSIDRAVAQSVCYMNYAEYVSFKFENSYDEPYIVYVDKLTVHTTTEEIEAHSKEYKENEVLFFDDFTDLFMVKPNTLLGQASEAPEISICRDPKFIKNGTGSLQLKLAVTPNRAGSEDYPGVTISGEAVSRIDFSGYSGVSFDIMGDAPAISNVSVSFIDANEVGYTSICHLQQIYEWKQDVPGFIWHTITADVKTMADSGLDMSKIDKINIYYTNLETGEPYSIYIDNITLVK